MSLAYKRLSPTARFEADIQRSLMGATPRHQKMIHKLPKKIAIALAKAAFRKSGSEAKGVPECHA